MREEEVGEQPDTGNTLRAELVYYERPEASGPKRCDYERLPVASANPLKQILASAIGIRTVVRKQRLVYLSGNVRIHLDTVEDLGHFLELEAVVGEEGTPAECAARVNALLERLDVNSKALLGGSYCDLMEEQGGAVAP